MNNKKLMGAETPAPCFITGGGLMKCETCGGKMYIAESRMVSELNSTDVYNELKMVCVNPLCDDFCGYDPDDLRKFKRERRKVEKVVTNFNWLFSNKGR